MYTAKAMDVDMFALEGPISRTKDDVYKIDAGKRPEDGSKSGSSFELLGKTSISPALTAQHIMSRTMRPLKSPLSFLFFFWGGTHEDTRESGRAENSESEFAPANRGPKGQPEHTTKRHPAPHLGDKLRTWPLTLVSSYRERSN